MRILFATKKRHLPQAVGGSQSSTHNLCAMLSAKGHSCAVMSELKPGDALWLQNRLLAKLKRKAFVHDDIPGYRVYRGWQVEQHAEEVAADFKPDVVIVQAGQPVLVANSFIRMGYNTAIYARDVAFNKYGGQPQAARNFRFIANSHFTAQKLLQHFNIPATPIFPIIQFDKYKVASTRKYVLFINPHPSKGADIALALAKANPDIPFMFVESWEYDYAPYKAIADQLGNIVWLKKQADMKKVYGAAKVLLTPSIAEEAWGRVASEVQVSGIPVLSSNRGGLPESVGQGGVLLDPDEPVGTWSKELRRLWTDDEHYNTLAARARDHSRREDIQPEFLLEKFVQALQNW